MILSQSLAKLERTCSMDKSTAGFMSTEMHGDPEKEIDGGAC
jgi:hypothetical protein